MQYKPFAERPKSTAYRDLLKKIRGEGMRVHPQQEEDAFMVFGYQMHFDLRDGFPLITERDLTTPGKKTPSVFHQALGELFAFLNGARTQTELEQFGCFWWKRWVTPEKCGKRGLTTGDLGPGSYGPAWCHFPSPDAEGTGLVHVNQFDLILQQVREHPHLRTHFITPWIPIYTLRIKGVTQKVVVAPCHGWLHILVNPDQQELSLHHIQRSGDVPVGLPSNIIQYSALTLMLARVLGYQAKELVYTISDAHVYEQQMTDVAKMLATEPQPFPTITLAEKCPQSLADFRQEHFTVTDYQPQLERMRIWTPV